MIPGYKTIPSGTYVLMDVTTGESAQSTEKTSCKSTHLAVAVLDGDHPNLGAFMEMDGSPSERTVLDWINR